MKVLWVCNVPNEDVYSYKGIEGGIGGGWLTGLSEALKSVKEIELVYCYPTLGKKQQEEFIIDNIHYYSFYSPTKWAFLLKFGVPMMETNAENDLQRKQLQHIIRCENPDIVHIFGTEYYHSYVVADLVEDKKKLVCSIQGLTSVIAHHYLRLIPNKILNRHNIASIFRGTLQKQQKMMEQRGKSEIKTLQLCPNIIGRTDWDEACTYFINPKRTYYVCNETLREAFYNKEWSISDCNKHTIFVSQSSSPLKGLNVLLKAIILLKNEYPDIQLRIAGNNFVDKSTLKKRLMISTYGEYIEKIIREGKLEKNISFLGPLSATQMASEYASCNVFVCPSSIENSSNSIGEAMVIGAPVVSSDVGGVNSLLKNGQEGELYQVDAPYMLAFKIKKIFDDEELAARLGKNAQTRAQVTHNPLINRDTMLDIYKSICLKKEEII